MWAAAADSGFFCVVIPFAAVFVPLMIRYLCFLQECEALERWAKDHGYQLLWKEMRGLLRGPFFLTSSTTQIVYRFEMQDRDGLVKRGWARIGGFLWPSAGSIEVRWDKPRPAPPDPAKVPGTPRQPTDVGSGPRCARAD